MCPCKLGTFVNRLKKRYTVAIRLRSTKTAQRQSISDQRIANQAVIRLHRILRVRPKSGWMIQVQVQIKNGPPHWMKRNQSAFLNRNVICKVASFSQLHLVSIAVMITSLINIVVIRSVTMANGKTATTPANIINTAGRQLYQKAWRKYFFIWDDCGNKNTGSAFLTSVANRPNCVTITIINTSRNLIHKLCGGILGSSWA